jgi:hypothetical protein
VELLLHDQDQHTGTERLETVIEPTRGWAAPGELGPVDNRGIVLVDEIDLHLHPEWQQRVIPTLARVLPNLLMQS